MASSRWKQAALAAVMMASGAAAAYPTPGATDRTMQLHPVALLDPRDVVEGFQRRHPGQDFSLVADARAGAVIAIGPPRNHAALARFIQDSTDLHLDRIVRAQREGAVRDGRMIVQFQLIETVAGVTRIVGEPRIEIAEDRPGVVRLDGEPGSEGTDWAASLGVRPRRTVDGRLALEVEAVGGPQRERARAEVAIAPGETLMVGVEGAGPPELAEVGRVLNAERPEARYSVTMKVRPL